MDSFDNLSMWLRWYLRESTNNLCFRAEIRKIMYTPVNPNFNFDIVIFPFVDGDVPRRTSYGVYISQLIRFTRASSNLNDFNYRNKT